MTPSQIVLATGAGLMLIMLSLAACIKIATRRERRLGRRRREWAEQLFRDALPDLRSDADHAAWLARHGGKPPVIPPVPR